MLFYTILTRTLNEHILIFNVDHLIQKTKMMAQDASPIELTENLDKITYAISYVIDRAQEKEQGVTQYEIVKALFIADTSHLNEWGRPITFDNYVAMKHGPVPSLSYDLLKHNDYRMDKFNLTADALPWVRVKQKDRDNTFLYHNRGVIDFEDVLSVSEMEALDLGLANVKKLGFTGVRKLTHEHEAYKEAWDENGESRSYQMRLEMLFDQRNDARERAEDLAELSTNHAV